MAQLLLGSPLPYSAQKAYFEGRDGPCVVDRERGSSGWGQGAWALEQEESGTGGSLCPPLLLSGLQVLSGSPQPRPSLCQGSGSFCLDTGKGLPL